MTNLNIPLNISCKPFHIEHIVILFRDFLGLFGFILSVPCLLPHLAFPPFVHSFFHTFLSSFVPPFASIPSTLFLFTPPIPSPIRFPHSSNSLPPLLPFLHFFQFPSPIPFLHFFPLLNSLIPLSHFRCFS